MNNPFDLLKLYHVAQLQEDVLTEGTYNNFDFFILYLCSKLINRTEFIIIACYVFLSITLEEAPEISWIYPIKIMITTIVASIVAMIVNLYDPRKKQRVRVYNEKNK